MPREIAAIRSPSSAQRKTPVGYARRARAIAGAASRRALGGRGRRRRASHDRAGAASPQVVFGVDPHHGQARALFPLWRNDQDARAVGVVNMTEVLIAPSAGVLKLEAHRKAITALGVTVHQPN